MKICTNCNKKFDNFSFRCTDCVQVLVAEEWLNTPRETRTPLKMPDIASIFSNEITSRSLAHIEAQLPKVNAEIGKDTGKFALLVFGKYVESGIFSDSEAIAETKNFTMFSLAWSSVCYIIGVENGKGRIEDDLVFRYIANVTDAFTNYFLAYIWNLHNRKLINTSLYQETSSGFSSVCYKGALFSEKNGYLESYKINEFNSNTIPSINQILYRQ